MGNHEPQGRGRHALRLSIISDAPGVPMRCRTFSLSFGERAGVRGNKPYPSPTCHPFAHTAQLLGFPDIGTASSTRI